MNLSYTREKLQIAANTLVGKGTLRDRLHSAGLTLVLLSPGPGAEFPDNTTRKRFDEIRSALTREAGEGDEGKLAATLNCVGDDEAERWALAILGLYVAVAEGAAVQGRARRDVH
jgi:hypothetical protein